MSEPRMCGAHLSKLNDDGECTWCRIAQRLPPHRAPYVLTADDIDFLRGIQIDPEIHTPTDLTDDPGGD